MAIFNQFKDLKDQADNAGMDTLIELLMEHENSPKALEAVIDGAQKDAESHHTRFAKTDSFRRERKKKVLADFAAGTGPFATAEPHKFVYADNSPDQTPAALIDDFTLSAAKGAAITIQKQELAAAQDASDKELLAVSMEMIKPVQEAIKSLSQINGIDISYYVGDQITRVYSSLKVANSEYTIFAEADFKQWDDEGGYAIYADHDYSGYHYEEYEGGGKTLNKALQAIAMIVGLKYPAQAAEIDKAVNDVIYGAAPSPAPAREAPSPAAKPEDIAVVVKQMQETLARSSRSGP